MINQGNRRTKNVVSGKPIEEDTLRGMRVMTARLSVMLFPTCIPTQQQFGIYPQIQGPLCEALGFRCRIMKPQYIARPMKAILRRLACTKEMKSPTVVPATDPETAPYPSGLKEEGLYLPKPVNKDWKRCLHRHQGKTTCITQIRYI